MVTYLTEVHEISGSDPSMDSLCVIDALDIVGKIPWCQTMQAELIHPSQNKTIVRQPSAPGHHVLYLR